MTGPYRPRLARAIVVSLGATALLFPSGANAKVKSFSPVREGKRALYFRVTGVRAARVWTAHLNVAGHRKEIAVGRLHRAIRQHRLFKVRLGRTVTERSKTSQARGSLVVATAPTTCPTSSSTYKSLITGTAGLAGYWRLDESAGTTACDATGANHGSYQGGFALGAGGALSGDADTAVHLDGSTGHVSVPSSSGLNPTSGLTVEAWVKPSVVTQGQTVARKDGQYLLRMQDDGTIEFRIWVGGTRRGKSKSGQQSGNTYAELVSPSVLSTGVYQYLAVTYDGATMTVYRNGSKVASRSMTGNLSTTGNPLYLGQSSGYDPLSGDLDEVAVYGRALTASQIQSRYTTAGGSDASGGSTDPGTGSTTWNLVESDDFSGTALDGTKWGTYYGQPGGDPGGFWDGSHCTVSNGVWNLETYRDPAFGNRWVSCGASNSKALKQTYGKYEVRMRMDAGYGVAGIAMLWPVADVWPPEIDFWENGGYSGDYTRQNASATLHYGLSNSQIQRSLSGVDFTQWHTVGVEWTPAKLAYTLDGSPWATVSDLNVPSQPMEMDVQTQAGTCGNQWAPCPDSTTPAHVNMQVDWVHAYSYMP
jgi:hypothetical protein